MAPDAPTDPRDETVRSILQLAAPLNRAVTVESVAEALARSALDMLGAAAVAVVLAPDLEAGLPGTRVVATSGTDHATAIEAVDCIVESAWGAELVQSDRSTGLARDDLDDAEVVLLDALGAVELDVHPFAIPGEHLGCVLVAWSPHRRREGAEAALRARALRDFGTMALRNASLLAQLRRRSLRDGLTGLANHNLLVERLDRAVAAARRRHRNFAVLLVELSIPSATEGALRDQLLVELAHRLDTALRHEDTVARVGDAQFAVLLPELDDPAPALEVATKLRDLLAGPVGYGVEPLEVTSSIGVAVHPHDGRTGDELLDCAEVALCRAVALGRGHVVRYEPALLADRERRTVLENELRDALAAASTGGRQLVVEYQPQVDLSDGRISGLEALVRWNHPTRGRLVPNDFLVTAEDSGLVVALDTWVLTRVCRDLDRWRRQGLAVPRVGVNVSVRDLRDPAFVDVLDAMLERAELPTGSIELEISDGLPLDEDGTAAAALVRIRGLGVSLAVDDFGTRRSELGQLRAAPIDTVKIDRRFVAEILHAEGPGLLVDGIVALSGALGMRSVACGVETDEQRAHLAAAGCDAVQGWLFAEPIDGNLIARLLSHAPVRATHPS
jgi:diguanylate cyclase (GGDEF)-like protein